MSETMSNPLEQEPYESPRAYRGRVISRALELGLNAELRNGKIIFRGAGWSTEHAFTAEADLFLRGYATAQADILAYQRETRRDSEQVAAAAADLLRVVDAMTTEEFRTGTEHPEREALRRALFPKASLR